MTDITTPDGLTFEQWATRMIDAYPSVDVPFPPSEIMWRDWAANLMMQPPFNALTIPTPSAFNDWRDWARRFCEVVE